MSKTAVLIIGAAPPAPGALPPKMFAKLDNREVFMRAIELYNNRDHVSQRVFCVLPDDLEVVQQKYSAHLAFQGVAVVSAGPDWFALVSRGLEKLKDEIETVIVHDAARPAVPFPLLDALDEAVVKTGAVVPVVQVGGTMATLTPEKNVDVWRDLGGMVEIQSPQIFNRKLLRQAYEAREKVKGLVLDDASLVRACGGRIATVPGSRYNVRVDGDEAIRMAADMVKHLPRPRSKAPISPFDEAQW